ncbi:uncharacterized protein LOC110438294, partial, partial [Tachysurus ichikawai]
MSHQVKVAEEDVDFLRFLWWPDGEISKEPIPFRMTVHLFGAVSSPSCACYALRRIAKDNQADFSEEVTETINNNFYMDDCLKSKMLLQELCRQNLGWDSVIPSVLLNQWKQWINELDKVAEFQVNRCFKPMNFGQPTHACLHHFADACETGYGTATYLKMQNSANMVHVAFMLGKARVTPLKPITIPRLELSAAVLAVKVDIMLKKELQLPLED